MFTRSVRGRNLSPDHYVSLNVQSEGSWAAGSLALGLAHACRGALLVCRALAHDCGCFCHLYTAFYNRVVLQVLHVGKMTTFLMGFMSLVPNIAHLRHVIIVQSM